MRPILWICAASSTGCLQSSSVVLTLADIVTPTASDGEGGFGGPDAVEVEAHMEDAEDGRWLGCAEAPDRGDPVFINSHGSCFTLDQLLRLSVRFVVIESEGVVLNPPEDGSPSPVGHCPLPPYFEGGGLFSVADRLLGESGIVDLSDLQRGEISLAFDDVPSMTIHMEKQRGCP